VNKTNSIKKEISKTRKEVKERMTTLMLAGFGIVAALAWNEAIRGLFDTFLPDKSASLIGKFIYALLITIIVVIISLQLKRVSEKKE